MQTEPPPSTSFSQTVNQWVIYDSYVEYELKKELQDEEEMKKKTYGTKAVKKRMLDDDEDKDGKELSDKVVKAARVLERMVNQNIYIDVALGKFDKQYKHITLFLFSSNRSEKNSYINFYIFNL